MNKPEPKEETFPRCSSPHLMSTYFLLAISTRDYQHASPYTLLLDSLRVHADTHVCVHSHIHIPYV